MAVVSVTAAGITGGDPRGHEVADRTITEHSYGIAPTTKDVKSGTAADAWSAYIAFDWVTLYIILDTWNFNLDIAFSDDLGVTYLDTMEIDAADAKTIPFSATGFRVKNTTPGSNARYEITGLGTGF